MNEDIIKDSLNFNYKDTPLKIGYFGAFTKSVREPNNYIINIANSLSDNIKHEWYINEESKSIMLNKETSTYKLNFWYESI